MQIAEELELEFTIFKARRTHNSTVPASWALDRSQGR